MRKVAYAVLVQVATTAGALSLAAGVATAQLEVRPTMQSRSGAALSYDSMAQAVVLSGGTSATSGDVLAETWTHTGGAWLDRTVPGQPALADHGQVCVTPTGQPCFTFVFGGFGGAGQLSKLSTPGHPDVGRTWLYDGNTWQDVSSPSDPPPRSNPFVAYDEAADRVVLFGGEGPNGPLDDTWVWTQANGWSEFTGPAPQLSGPARGLAFNPLTSRVALGSWPSQSSIQFHEFDGQQWVAGPITNLYPLLGHPFGNVSECEIARGPTGFGVAVMFEYDIALMGSISWDGTSFTDRGHILGLGVRTDFDLYYDAAHDALVVHGGRVGTAETYPWPNYVSNASWLWDGSTLDLIAGSPPENRSLAMMVATPGRGGVLMAGGSAWALQTGLADTWRYSGGSWQRTATGGVPSGSAFYETIAYDPVRDRVVRFDGSTTWEHDGTTWNSQPAGGVPPAGTGPMAYDPTRSATVLCTGASFGSVRTWTWDGTDWAEVVTATHPDSPAALAFDTVANELLLMTRFGELWALTSDWELRSTVTGGPAGSPWVSGATFDESRGRLQVALAAPVFGGCHVVEWDGVAWSAPLIVPSPATPSIAYDPQIGASIVLAGPDTWLIGSTHPSQTVVRPNTCVATGTTPPTLRATAPGPWIGTTFEQLVSGAGGATPVLGVIGYSDTQWEQLALPLDLTAIGMTGCMLLTSLDLTNALTSASWPLPVPNHPGLVGHTVFTQALVPAPGINPLGALATNALELRIGQL